MSASVGPGNVVPDFKTRLSGAEFETNELAAHHFTSSSTSIVKTVVAEDEIYYFDGVLSESECAMLTSAVDACPALSFWSAKGRNHEATRKYRNVDTVEVHYQRLSSALSDRLNAVLEVSSIVLNTDDGIDLAGEWRYSGVNHDCLFSRYPSGGSFAPHTDGSAVHGFDDRSFFSVILFLNTLPKTSGGGTRFYKNTQALHALTLSSPDEIDSVLTSDASLIEHEVFPVAGRLLIFRQHLVHEGVPPHKPHRKYIMRSDLMFTRTPGVLQSEADVEAYRIYQEAEQLSELGQVAESIVLFRRALRMSPTLARALGQA